MNEEQFINDFYKGSDYRKFEVLKEMYRENQQLKESTRYLQGLITNKIMVSEGYESVLKDKFNELELKYLASTNSCSDLENKLKQRDEVIDEAIKHIQSLSSKGRDCMIYADVKKDILDILKKYKKEGMNNDVNNI